MGVDFNKEMRETPVELPLTVLPPLLKEIKEYNYDSFLLFHPFISTFFVRTLGEIELGPLNIATNSIRSKDIARRFSETTTPEQEVLSIPVMWRTL